MFINEQYIPLPFDKYITIQPYTKNSKNYDYFADVIHILHPILEKEGIKIVQIGGEKENPIAGCYFVAGSLTIRESAYVVKNSLLHLSADSYSAHLAGHYNIPLVALYSNNYVENVRPYFRNDDNQILLDGKVYMSHSLDKRIKPSFAFDENPKSINFIPIEDIINGVCKLLNINYRFPYKTVYVGENFKSKMVETVPVGVTNNASFGINNLIVRFDFGGSEDFLAKQMEVCNCSIITDKPINLDLLTHYKSRDRIKELIYFINETNDLNFVQRIRKIGIPFVLFSWDEEERVNEYKLKYFDYSVVLKKNIPKQNDIPTLSGLNINDLFYKSSKITVNNGQLFPSFSAILQYKPIQSVSEIVPAVDEVNWWKELEYFYVLKKLD